MESWTWTLPIVQGLCCTVMRWAGNAIFYPPPPTILTAHPNLTALLYVQGFVVSITVIVLGFMYASHPWWLLLAVFITVM
jgi:hypothetical protein